ncbi:protein brambleberry-like [Uranotaenia lowii]|uniref:protein brambleberry-like n=1 Tax=Uranotaenia lowii TaxID=190385 RepID=UPI0024788B9C|nr:protein brambleberry-like [Uranotaenia lowii]
MIFWKYKSRFTVLVLMLFLTCGKTSFVDYIWPSSENSNPDTAVDTLPGVPYELAEGDEAFLREASKWIGNNLSKLDFCHHRVILKLKNSCNQLNAEEIGKLAVMLLNCQSDSEGRRIYPCTEQMSLKECTSNMDPDTWNAYHLVTNRAKAVCASVRHDQFRGLTELTVNKLMSTAHEQITMMGQLAENQKELQSVTQEAIDEMSANNDRIISQQGDIMRLSETHRAKVESNFRELVREKSLIRAGQQEVAILLTDLRTRIDDSIKQLESQSKRSKLNHASLLSDMETLQKHAAMISNKIDETGTHFASHHKAAEEQYQYTLGQLQKINNTVANMLTMIGALQKDFNQKLNWITEKVGGSDYILRKMNTIVVHFCYLVLGMICLSFIGVDKFIRIFFILLVPGNLMVNLLDLFESDVIQLSVVLVSFILADVICRIALKFVPKPPRSNQSRHRRRNNQTEPSVPSQPQPGTSRRDLEVPVPASRSQDQTEEENDRLSYLGTLRSRFSRERSQTPLTRNGSVGRRSMTPLTEHGDSEEDEGEELQQRQQQCTARTLRGERCRSVALTGRDFCRMHDQRGL